MSLNSALFHIDIFTHLFQNPCKFYLSGRLCTGGVPVPGNAPVLLADGGAQHRTPQHPGQALHHTHAPQLDHLLNIQR